MQAYLNESGNFTNDDVSDDSLLDFLLLTDTPEQVKGDVTTTTNMSFSLLDYTFVINMWGNFDC